MDVFGQDQNHLIETYTEGGARRGLSEIGHMTSDQIKDLLDGADAVVIRDPSQVSGRVLSELDTSSYARSADDGFGYRGVYLGDEKLVEEELLYDRESLETGGGLLMG